MPEFIQPMLATPVDRAFSNPDWLFEMKLDGYRIEAVVARRARQAVDAQPQGRRALLPRRSRRHARTGSPAYDAIVDGEVVALDPDGRPDFSLLQDLSGLRGLGAHRGSGAAPNAGV